MKSKDNADLGNGTIWKLLLSLAIPAIAAQIINALYNIVDRIYIGHMPEVGATALTGVGVCFPFIMLISAFSSLISMGGSPRASIAMGEGKKGDAENILGNCTTALLICSVLIMVIYYTIGNQILTIFGASDNTMPYSKAYMNIYIIGTAAVQLALGLNMFITAQGFAKTSMKTVLIGAVLNIILDPIFIFGFNLGVRGAALATILSQTVSAIWVIVFLTGKKTEIKIKKDCLSLKPAIILPVLTLGFAPFIMQSTESLIMLCFNSSLLKYGGDIAVGAMTILTSIMQFVIMPLMGLTQASQPIISYNYGAKKIDRVQKAFKLLLLCSFTYTIIAWLLIMLFPRMFASIFTKDSELMMLTAWAIRIYMGGSLMLGAQIACQQTFIALDNPVASIFLALLRKIVLLIPLIYILPLLLSDDLFAVFLAEPTADIIAATVTVIVFSFQFSKLKKKHSVEKA